MRDDGTFMHKTDLDDVYGAIVNAAELADVPYSKDIIWSVLNAYKDFFSGSAVSSRTTTRPKEIRGVNVRYLETDVVHDPFQIALDAGFIKKKEHPITDLFYEAKERFPLDGFGGHGIDLGVDYGLEKIWLFFNGVQPIEEVYKMPSRNVSSILRQLQGKITEHLCRWAPPWVG